VFGVQKPLLTFHSKLFCPMPRELTVVLKLPALPRVPVPPTTLQLPVPVAGATAVMTVELAQIVCAALTTAGEGTASRYTTCVAVDAGQDPLLMDHTKLFWPIERLLTPLVFVVAETSDAVPLRTDQLPVPTEGRLPDKVKPAAQIV
jgi:hypothetical protein